MFSKRVNAGQGYEDVMTRPHSATDTRPVSAAPEIPTPTREAPATERREGTVNTVLRVPAPTKEGL